MLQSQKPQVVIDTNVWISGLIFGGNPEKVMRLFVEGQIIVVTAEELLSELRRKVIKRFPLYESQLALFEASIREDALLVRLGTVEVSASRDTDDNKFIEAAVIGNAQYIISGDKDLLEVDNYKGVKILKPADFLQIL